jgi:hypothetical protein
MRTIVRPSWLLGLATLTLASGAFAGTVSFKLTGVSGASMAGVYTSPYTATINGVPVLAICDDYATDSYIGDSFTATVTNVASLQDEATASQDVKFNKDNATTQQKNYATAAYLATQLLSIDQTTSAGRILAGEYSFAIWGLFYAPAITALNNFSPTYAQAAQNILNAALALNLKPSDYANVDIYTPTPIQSVSQEFIVVRTDEPEAITMLGFNILAVLSLVFFFRKRLIRAA